MAPRARPRTYRNTRMDGAVEAMTKEYGFSEEVVKRVLGDLLEEYGGEDGWFFIEQYYYKELIEAILRDPEANDQENSARQDSLQGKMVDANTQTDAAEPSGVIVEPVCSMVVENKLEKGTREDVNRKPPTEGVGKGRKNIGLDQTSGQREITNAVCVEEKTGSNVEIDKRSMLSTLQAIPPTPLARSVPIRPAITGQREIVNAVFYMEEKTGSNENIDKSSMLSPLQVRPPTPLAKSVPSRPENSPILSPLPMIYHPPSPANVVSTRRRMPCYGWIESDEEDADDFIELTPAVKATAKVKLKSWEYVNRRNKPAKRRSMWDLKPGDL